MKRLLTLLSLMVLSACTIGQPAANTVPPAPTPLETPSVSDSGSPSPSPSEDSPSGSPSPDPSTDPEESPSEQPSGSPSPSTSTSTSPDPSTSPAGSAGSFRAPGEVLDLGGEVTVTVLDSKRAKVSGHRSNQVLVMAKSCNVTAAAGIELTWDSWVLLGPDSEEYPASTTRGNSEPVPVYPNGSGRLYKPGQCAKGWIVFDVPTSAKLSGVRYMNSNGDSGQWRLNANI
ncbi:MAG: hypothetical protein QM582_10190 [Micropruina sp.]|uniref:hypothetical protein n=1 Tax=Micropruina sp. TaxID=2737536 RepID=UPI0039E491B5